MVLNPLEIKFVVNGNNLKNVIGWEDFTLDLERHNDYHGVIFFSNFEPVFVGDDAEYILHLINQDPDGSHTIEIYLNNELVLTGLLEIASADITYFNNLLRVKCGIKKTDVWSKLIQRKGIEFNLIPSNSLGLDGQPINTSVSDIELLPIEIESRFKNLKEIRSASSSLTNSPLYLMVSYEPEENSIEEVFDYGMNISTIPPYEVEKYFIHAKYQGRYSFTGLVYSRFIFSSAGSAFSVKCFVKLNDNTPIQVGSTVSITQQTGFASFQFGSQHAFNCNPGDKIYLYIVLERTSGTPKSINSFSNATFESGFYVGTDFTVTARTTYPTLYRKSLTLEEALRRVIYGCNSQLPQVNYTFNASVMKGKMIRVEQGIPFATSFDKLFASTSKIFPIGLTYDEQLIRIVDVATLYDNEVFAEIVFREKPSLKLNLQKYISTVEIGYAKYESSLPGLRTGGSFVATNANKNIGSTLNLVSDFVSDQLIIEEGRRLSIDPEKDWGYDEDIFIIETQNGQPPNIGSYNLNLRPNKNFNRLQKIFQTAKKNFQIKSSKGLISLVIDNYDGRFFSAWELSGKCFMDFDLFQAIKQSGRHKMFAVAGSELKGFLKVLSFNPFKGEADITLIVNFDELDIQPGFTIGYSLGYDA
jgi:hypothetical protein